MTGQPKATVAIVDYCAGNLFSVARACERVGLNVVVTGRKNDLTAADAVILPGVGAFGDAMNVLRDRDLIGPLKHIAESGKPLIGICLGMQLLMTESHEFGRHRGLGLIEGDVVRFVSPSLAGPPLKVPHVGWSRVFQPTTPVPLLARKQCHADWRNTPLADVPHGQHMYFVHSYHAQPADQKLVLAVTDYGGIRFCSSLHRDNIWAFQFHPEKSGPLGIRIYERIATDLHRTLERERHHAA